MQRINIGTAYLLWCLGIFGICGIQRLYTGRIFSGLIYFFTFGIFGLGQLIDLILIPGMVESRNRKLLDNYIAAPLPSFSPPPHALPTISPMQKLLMIAKQQGGQLSMAQAALYTELEPKQVQQLLQEAQRLGYAEVCNDPQTGAIRYRFDL